MPRRLLVLPLLVAALACITVSSVTPVPPTVAPTDAPTELPPTQTLVPTEPPGPTAIPGWLTYHNGMIGYSFDYPPEAVFTTTGVNGFPSEELPAGLEPGQYFATLEAIYTEPLCAGIELAAASFVLWAPQEEGGRYSGPCGVTGIGVYDIRKDQSPITIDGEALSLGITRLYEVGTEVLVDEFGTVSLSDGTRFTFVGTWRDRGLTYEDFLEDRAIVLQVMSSYRSDP